MTWEYLHLIAHSFPIVLTVSGTLVGLLGWARGKPELERWALVALLIAAGFVVPAYVTGLAAADVVADRTFVRPGVVQSHRFAATWAAIPVFTAGALAAFALHEREDRRLRRFVLLVGLGAALAIGWAAWQGARIQHGDREAAARSMDGAGTARDDGPGMQRGATRSTPDSGSRSGASRWLPRRGPTTTQGTTWAVDTRLSRSPVSSRS